MRKTTLLSLPVLGAVALFALSSSAQASPGYFNKDGYYFCQGSASDCQQHKEQIMATCGARGGDQQACRASGGSVGGSSILDRRATDGRGMNSNSVIGQSGGAPGYFNSDGYYVCQSSEEACQQHKEQVMASCGAKGGNQQACRTQQTEQRINEIADKHQVPGITPTAPAITNEQTLQGGYQKEYNGAKTDSQRCSILRHAQSANIMIDINQNPFEQGDESQCSSQSGGNQQSSTPQAAPTPTYTKTHPKPSTPTAQPSQPATTNTGGSTGGGSSSGGSSSSSGGGNCTPSSPCSYHANNGETYTITNPKVNNAKIDEDGNFVCYNSRYQKISCN